MKKLFIILFLLSNLSITAQKYNLYVIFDNNEFTQNDGEIIDDIGQYFYINKKKCDDKPIYNFEIDENNILKKGVIADNSWSDSFTYTFLFNPKMDTIKKIKRKKIKKNYLTNYDITKSDYNEMSQLLRNAKNLYILVQPENNLEYFIQYKVSYQTL